MQELLKKYKTKADGIQILQDVQKKYGYISKLNLKAISEKLDIPYSHLYSIATFYKSFSLNKRGRYIIRICDGTACHLKGSTGLLEEIKERLDIEIGETTTDGLFTLETVACMGVCALAPVMVIGEKYYGNLDRSALAKIIETYIQESTQ